MNKTSHRLIAKGHLRLVLVVASSGCSPEGNKITMVDQHGKETVVRRGVNASATNVQGESQATIRASFPDGAPAAQRSYRLGFLSDSPSTVASSGMLSAEGIVTIEGFAAGDPPVLYDVEIDGQLVGSVPVGLDRQANQFEFLLAARAGMKAPSLALRQLDNGARFQLADLRGQVVLVDFYATTCAPCQPGLQGLEELLERRAKSWRGKVTVLAIGLDAVQQPGVSAEVVTRHLRRKGWKHLQPVVPDYEFSWEPTKRMPFGVNGVPRAFILGADGTILWSGIESAVELEQKVEKVLAGNSERAFSTR